MHAWDCRCGTRNAPNFRHCRNCGAAAFTGSAVGTRQPIPSASFIRGAALARPVGPDPQIPLRVLARGLWVLQQLAVMGAVVVMLLLCPWLLILLLAIRGGAWFYRTMESIARR